MMRHILLTISYDGKNFYGFQRQKGKRTVQGELEEALSKFTGIDIKVDGCSRTDRGVHALGQTVSFSGDFTIPLKNLVYACNNYFRGGLNSLSTTGDLRIIKAKNVRAGFHARFDAKGKTYMYIIDNAKTPNLFRRDYSFNVNCDLDIDLMIEASKYILGTHDFKCFESSGSNPRETTVRTVKSIDICRGSGRDIIIEITGDGFLYNMVRIIVGTLVEVGLKKREPHSLKDVIESCDRSKAGFTAPPQGLYLKKIYY